MQQPGRARRRIYPKHRKLGVRQLAAANEAAVAAFGSKNKLAKAIGLANGTIRRREQSGSPFLTAEEAVTAENLTRGRLPRYVSRPDLWTIDMLMPQRMTYAEFLEYVLEPHVSDRPSRSS